MRLTPLRRSVFMKRTYNITRHMAERAAEACRQDAVNHGSVPPTINPSPDLDQIRGFVLASIADGCPYCGKNVTFKTFTIDHGVPIDRGGSFGLSNLVLCCDKCNRVKGNMKREEFDQLLDLLQTFPAEAANDVLGRLKAGSGMWKQRFIARKSAERNEGTLSSKNTMG